MRIDAHSAPQFSGDYAAEILPEIPSPGRVRYFPEGSANAPMAVRFTLPDSSSWVGAFERGTATRRACTGVFAWPSPRRACVVSNGCAYQIDVDNPESATLILDELVMQVVPVVSAGLLLFADWWQLYAYGAEGLRWSSGRIAMDGMTVVAVDEGTVIVSEDHDGIVERTFDVRTGRLLSVARKSESEEV